MSGSLKLKIKLKPRLQDTESAQGRSDHKRKLNDYSPQHSGVPSSATNGSHSETKRPKKQKHQQAAGQLQPSGSGPKLKLHIKGPWSKAASASDNKDPHQASSGHPQQPYPGKNAAPTVTLKQRPPAKAVQVLGQADAGAPVRDPNKKQKVKGFGKVKQGQGQPAANAALETYPRGGAASASEDLDLQAPAAQDEAPMAQIPKIEGNVVLAVPTRAILERIVDKMQRKDNFNIFRDPVTEAMAPGYFQVVQRGMDFTTMRSKVQGESYSAWQEFQDDMDVMFGNAMAYNSPETVYHKQARSLKAVAAKMIELAKQGVTDFRGKTVQESRAHNAQIAAEEQAYRNEQRDAKATSLASKVAEQFGTAGASYIPLRHAASAGAAAEAGDAGQSVKAAARVHRPVVRESDMRKFAGQEEQNNRATYWQTPQAQYYTRWKGLAAGATGESVALHSGRPILRPVVLLNKDTYACSIARFTAGLKGKFKQLAKARATLSAFSDPTLYSQTLNSVQLPTSSVPGMSPAGCTTAAAASSLSRLAVPFSSAQAGAVGGLAAGAGLRSAAGSHVGLHSTVAGLSSASQPAAARPVSMSYATVQPQSMTHSAHSVQQHSSKHTVV